MEVLAPWIALKFTLSVMPAFFLLTWAAYAGHSPDRVRCRTIVKSWIQMKKAETEGLKETGAVLFPVVPFIGYIAINIVLYLVPFNTMFERCCNVAAIPAAVLFYWKGKESRKYYIRRSVPFEEYDMSLFTLAPLVLLWFLIGLGMYRVISGEWQAFKL